MSDHSLIIQVQSPSGMPHEVLHVRRLLSTRELTHFDIDLDGTALYYEVTRFTMQHGKMRQHGEPVEVHIDPDHPDRTIRLAYLALEATHEGESRDDAWLDAKREADAEIEEVVEQKDEYIGKQSDIIMACMEVFTATGTWGAVPVYLHEELRNYV